LHYAAAETTLQPQFNEVDSQSYSHMPWSDIIMRNCGIFFGILAPPAAEIATFFKAAGRYATIHSPEIGSRCLFETERR
jgi:hypothetical protein